MRSIVALSPTDEEIFGMAQEMHSFLLFPQLTREK